jgi:hypothetical protein
MATMSEEEARAKAKQTAKEQAELLKAYKSFPHKHSEII